MGTCCEALSRSTLSSPLLLFSRPSVRLLTMPEKKKRKLTTVCTICSGPSASHLHYGAIACYSCRAFFRRGIGKSYCCVEGTGDCNIDWTCRRSCQGCRFDKSVSAGPQLKLYGKKIKIPENPIFLNLFLFSNKILICSDA